MSLQKIVGTRLDDINMHTQGHMHEHIGKRAKMQRNRESQIGWHKASKASISSNEVEKGMPQANLHHGDMFSQMTTSKQAIEGMDATKQASGPKDKQAQTHGGHKAWQEPRSSQTNMDLKYKSKQAYTCIKERIQTLCYRPRYMDLGFDHKIKIYILHKGQSTRKRRNKRQKGKAKH